MNNDLFLIGIDGGGTGTRVVLGDSQGRELAQAASGPSGLGLGTGRAWQSIEAGCVEAFARAGVALDWSHCVLGCGLAGANNRDWLAEFHAQAPKVAGLAVEQDSYTTLLGAHGGEPGVIVALGTGSVAAVLDGDGECRVVSGYGFPSGDEASGVVPTTTLPRLCSLTLLHMTMTASSSGSAPPIRPLTRSSRGSPSSIVRIRSRRDYLARRVPKWAR
jgi:glucosamine kinase